MKPHIQRGYMQMAGLGVIPCWHVSYRGTMWSVGSFGWACNRATVLSFLVDGR